MVAKKKYGKKKNGKKREVLTGDPPILVGGGGSSFIWIKNDQEPQFMDPTKVPNNAPKPDTPANYFCIRVKKDVTAIDVDDGLGGGPGGGKPSNDKKFKVKFE